MMKTTTRIAFLHLTCIFWHFYATSSYDSPFEKVTKEDTFVDKTSLIKTFFAPSDSNSSYILITCPPRFGKSVNLDMIKRFVEYNESQEIINKNRNLFTNPNLNLEISKDTDLFEEYFGNFVVIQLDFFVACGKTFSEIVTVIRNQIKKVFVQYACLFRQSKDTYTVYEDHKLLFHRIISENATIKELINSLGILSNNLFAYYGKNAILLVDNFDAPVRKALENGVNAKGIITITQSMLNQALRGNVKHIKYAFLTGISNLIGAVTYSEVDDIKRFNFLEEHAYLQYFGFTMKDMEKLYGRNRFKVNDEAKNDINRYCNGYHTQLATIRLFNPALVVDFLEGKKIGDDWPKIGSMDHLQIGLRDAYLRKVIGNFFSTIKVTIKYHTSLGLNNLADLEQLFVLGNDTFIDTGFYLSLLVEMGYFSFVPLKRKFESTLTAFTIPNEHVKLQLAYDFYKFFTTLISDGERKFANIFQLLKQIIENETPTVTQKTQQELSIAIEGTFKPLFLVNQTSGFERLYEDYRLVLYAAALYGSLYGRNRDDPAPKFDTVECSAPIAYSRKPMFDLGGGRVDVSILGSNQTTMLFIEVKEQNEEFVKLQDVLDRVRNFRPKLDRHPVLQSLNYVKFLAIHVNKRHQVEIGLAPTIQYNGDGQWVRANDEFSQ